MSGNAREARILGSLRSADGKGVVRIEDRYDTDIDDLWGALTDPAAWLAGGAWSKATSAPAESSACPPSGRAPGEWRRASPRGGCR